MSNPASISGVDLTTPQGRQILQDALDVLYGLIQKAGGTAAGPTTFDELRVRMLTVLGTIDVVPEDKPPANVNSRLVTPWLTGQRGRGEVWRFEDQKDGGDLLEVRSQPYLVGTPTATAGDWEFRFTSAQRDPAGAYRSLGAIRFGSDGRIRTYDASEVLGFDSTASSGFTLANKGELHGHDGGTDAAVSPGSDGTIPTYDSAAAEGITPKSITSILTDAGIDFTTGATTGRAPVTQEFEARPGTATHTYTPSDALKTGETWRITVWGDATGGTAYIKYDGASGTTLTSATGTNPFCIQAFIAYKTATSLECTGFFASDGGTTILTPTITGTTPSKQIAVSAGSGGTISKWIVERIGDTAAGTAGGSGASNDANVLWLPTPYWTFDAQDPDWFTLASGAVTSWFASGSDNGRIFGQATTGNKPAYTGALNDATSQVDFDGTNDYLSLGSGGPTTHQSGDLTIVFTPDSLSGSPALFGFAAVASTPYWIIYLSSTGAIDFYSSVGSVNLRTATGLITAGQKNVIRFTSDNITTRCEVNGVSAALTAVAGSNTGLWFADVAGNTFALGAQVWNGTVTTFFNGKIHELIYHGSTTTSGGRFQLPNQLRWTKNYLNNRWGLSLPL